MLANILPAALALSMLFMPQNNIVSTENNQLTTNVNANLDNPTEIVVNLNVDSLNQRYDKSKKKNRKATLKLNKAIYDVKIGNKINLPSGVTGAFKTYMDYRTITDKSSTQWHMQQDAYTDSNGLRKIGRYYCVALGSGITNQLGAKFKVTLENGNVLYIIKAEAKSDRHTDKKTHTYIEKNGNIIEFIVQDDKLPSSVITSGNVGEINGFEGKIYKIEPII